MKQFWNNKNSIAYYLTAWLVLITVSSSLTAPLTLYAEEEAAETPPVEAAEEETPPAEPDDPAALAPPENGAEGEVTIESGDATAALSSETEVNTNETDTSSSSPATTTTAAAPATSTSLTLFPVTDTASSSVTNKNTATSSTAATTTANTGGNVAASGDSAAIASGDAVAYADIVNVVNTNITNSTGLIDFVNDVLGYQDFDLRDEFTTAFDTQTAASTPACSLDNCQDNGTNFTVNNDNDATIENEVTVIANTGGNAAGGDSATVTTGDAYASANIINVANTNVTDSNYLLLVFNNFDSYAGDIVLPNSNFFAEVLAGSGGVNDLIVENSNTAAVSNNVTATADTGNNTAVGDTSQVQTGDGTATGGVTNLLNTNVTGGTSFSMLIRVNGEWSGDIYGLPEGMSWARTNEGVRIFTSNSDTGARSVSADHVSNTNNARINNNVQVYALTGENQALGNTAAITTGNAYAEASVLNVANTNIVGSNWANLIFNIYGNWSGSLTFGQPDLWLGVRATSEDNPIMPGSLVTYTYTIFNSGDVLAENVQLENVVAGGLLRFGDSDSFENYQGQDHTAWHIGTVAPGATIELQRTAHVTDLVPASTQTIIPLTARVSSQQSDANPEDNEDRVDINTGFVPTVREDRSGTIDAKLDIKKTASTHTAAPGDTIHYTISIFNRGGKLYDAALTDVLEDHEGNTITEQLWPLDEVDTHELITIEYDTTFATNAATGSYTNYAQVIGMHGSTKPKYQEPYYSALATREIVISDAPAGLVLGAQTTSCPAYLTTYLRYGIDNSEAQVRKLQVFLNEYTNAALAVSGLFDQTTEHAVRAFQREYASDILDPWGLTEDSGYVYYTTQKKINEIVCENQTAFPLTAQQEAEMLAFKQRLEVTPLYHAAGVLRQ